MIENTKEQYDCRFWLPGLVDGLWLDETQPLKLERRRHGLLQFYATCDRLDAQPLIVVPTKPGFQGQWSVRQAADFAAGLVAFSNADTPSDVPASRRGWVEARLRAGRAVPAGVTYWQIGNEIWLYKRNMQRRWRQEAEERGVAPAEVNPLADNARHAKLRLLLGRTDLDLGDPDHASVLLEITKTIELDGGVVHFELPAKAVAVLIIDGRLTPWLSLVQVR
ncbi:MAG: hypothetical protein AAF710_08520 [Planctomycetota bacterium]